MSGTLKQIEAQKKISTGWIYDLFIQPILPSKVIESGDGGNIGFNQPVNFDSSFLTSEEANMKSLGWTTFEKRFLGKDKNPENEQLYFQANQAFQAFINAFTSIYQNPETQKLMLGDEFEQHDQPYSLAGRSIYRDDELVKELERSGNPQETFVELKKQIGHFKGKQRNAGFVFSMFQNEAIKLLRSLAMNDGNTVNALTQIRSLWEQLGQSRVKQGKPTTHGISFASVFELFLKEGLFEYNSSDPSDMSLEYTYHQFIGQVRRFPNVKKYFEKLSVAVGSFATKNGLDAKGMSARINEIKPEFEKETEIVVKMLKDSLRNDISDRKKLFKQRGTMNDPTTDEPYQTLSMHEYAIIDIMSVYGYAFAAEVEVPMLDVNGQVMLDNSGREVKKRVDFAFPNNTYLEVFGVERKEISKKKQQQTQQHPWTRLNYKENKNLKMREWKGKLYYVDTEGKDGLFAKNISRPDVDTQRPLTMYCDLLDVAAFFDDQSGQYTNTGLQGNTNHKDQFLQRFSLLVGQQNEIAVNFYRLWANDSMGPEQLIDYVSKVTWMRSQGTDKDVPGSEYFDVFQNNPDVVVPREQLAPKIPEDAIDRAYQFPQQGVNNVASAFDHMLKSAQMQNMVNVQQIEGLPKMEEMRSSLASTMYSVANNIASEFEIVAMYFQTFENLMSHIQQIIAKLDQFSNYQNQPLGYVGQQPQQFQQPMGIAADSWTWEMKTAQRAGDSELTKAVRDHIKSDPFFHRLFGLFGVNIDLVDTELECQKADLGTRNAKSKGNMLYFNYNLFDDGDFFENGIHYVVHEMTHWLTNQREEQCYFADPEEMQAFTLGIAYEIFRGLPKKMIVKTYFPIIEKHFSCQGEAAELFNKFYRSAIKLQRKLGK